MNLKSCIPEDVERSLLVGRVATEQGPSICLVKDGEVLDITKTYPTISHLLSDNDCARTIADISGPVCTSLDELFTNSKIENRDSSRPYLLAPVDIQAVKACGVTFVNSLIERVVEETARGDPKRAKEARKALESEIGDDLRNIEPASDQASKVKFLLSQRGLWSQYLEVGLGPDVEIFTKAQPMSSVGYGDWIGIHPSSNWNNPEPEVVLIVSPTARIMGVTLGNDVNLRDIEGRSALLLGRAKDNNASCALGPFIRLLDDHFSLDDVRSLDLQLKVRGEDGYVLEDSSTMKEISRDPLELVNQLFDCHQYPDGAALFTGTLFAPTQDREMPGEGFSHKYGDLVSISCNLLGTLSNRVGLSSEISPWTFGTLDLMRSLNDRQIIY